MHLRLLSEHRFAGVFKANDRGSMHAQAPIVNAASNYSTNSYYAIIALSDVACCKRAINFVSYVSTMPPECLGVATVSANWGTD